MNRATRSWKGEQLSVYQFSPRASINVATSDLTKSNISVHETETVNTSFNSKNLCTSKGFICY